MGPPNQEDMSDYYNITMTAMAKRDLETAQELVRLDEMKSGADGLVKLMDANITRGNPKNLVTDKPSPITVGLTQKICRRETQDPLEGSSA